MEAKIFKTAHGSIQLGMLEKSALVAITAKFVELDVAGLAVNATPTSTAIAYVVAGGELGSTQVQVVADKDVVYSIDADRVLVDTDRNKEIDLVTVGTDLVADMDASTTDVLKTLAVDNAFLTTTRLLVTINKPILG